MRIMTWQLLTIPGAMIGLSIPLILRMVPRNHFYGFRTAKTLSDDGIWYELNQGSGWDMVFAAAAQLVLVLLKPSIEALSEMPPGPFIMATQMPLLGLAVAHSFWRLRKL